MHTEAYSTQQLSFQRQIDALTILKRGQKVHVKIFKNELSVLKHTTSVAVLVSRFGFFYYYLFIFGQNVGTHMEDCKYLLVEGSV